MHNAVYNSRIPDMLLPMPHGFRVAPYLLIVFMFLQACRASTADWMGPAEQLAGKIVAVMGPGAVSVNFSNRSSLSRTDFEEVRRGLTTQLAALGARFVSVEQAAATVQISLSEDLQNYVWVAEIHQGTNESSVVMVSLPRPEGAGASHEAAALSIRKTLLWSQADRILDVAVIDGSPSHMVILDPNAVALYKFQDGRWQREQSLAISHTRPWPRDMRGRLILRKDHLFDAYLPGVFCRSTASALLAINCSASDDPWPIGTEQFNLSAFFTPARNFFTGALSPGVGKQTTAPPFYSAAALPREKYTLWLLAGVDGQIHFLDGMTDQTVGKLSWGSDIATVRTGCGSGWQVLATRNGDGPGDAVRAFELPDREPVVASQAVEFTGGITSMWAESGGSSVIAVSRSLETGNYEAFRLTVACGQ
jgi:hypothetical protein